VWCELIALVDHLGLMLEDSDGVIS